MSGAIIRVGIWHEQDVVQIHRRARLIAAMLGFDQIDQARISTAVSEISRHVLLNRQNGLGGEAIFSIEGTAPKQWFCIAIHDDGSGFADLDVDLQELTPSSADRGLGLTGIRRLLPEYFHIQPEPGHGTTVTLGKTLPPTAKAVTAELLQHIAEAMTELPLGTSLEELSEQNIALQAALELLRQREHELASVNAELSKTNIGVVALYVDLKDKTQQVVQGNAALTSFNYSVAHDLRAPLRGIDGWSLALLEDYADRLDDEGRRHLQRIRSDAQRMNELIDDMLRLSKVTASVMEIRPVDLSAMAEKIIGRLREQAPHRQIECAIQQQLLTSGDPKLLEITLTNLLGNAWKFTGKNPQPRIEMGMAKDAEQEGDEVFFVRDNGVGFDMQYAQKLFTPFQRMHAELDFPGTGVGLATVQRIVQRHGGRVWAEAEVGKGATFYFSLGRQTAH
jgi:signal transduction histidine kinase/anti-sigma regulatory factor (Ser/Thr protein kinase)